MNHTTCLLAALCLAAHLNALAEPMTRQPAKGPDPLALDSDETAAPPPTPPSAPFRPTTPPAPAAVNTKAPRNATPLDTPQSTGELPLAPNNRSARFGELDALRSQNALLAERVKAMELLSRLKGTASTPAEMTMPRSRSSTSGLEGLQLIAVEGIDQDRTATVQTPTGQKVTVTAGSTLPGGAVVQHITVNGLCATAKGKSMCLGFASTAPTGN